MLAMQILTAILAQRANSVTYLALAESLYEQPESTMAAVNQLRPEDAERILDNCESQQVLGLLLLQNWLGLAEQLESRNLQRYLCDKVLRLTSSQSAVWQQRFDALSPRLAEAVAQSAQLADVQAHHANLASEYAVYAEKLQTLSELQQELVERRATLNELKSIDVVTLRQQRDSLQLEIDRQQSEQVQLKHEVQMLTTQAEELKTQIEQQVRPTHDQVRKVYDELRRRLGDLQKRGSRLGNTGIDDPELQTEEHELKKLLKKDGELERRLTQFYDNCTRQLETKS